MTDLAFIESSEFNEFIKNNKDANTMQLRLKKFNNLSFDLEFALQQIECRKKATGKIPELAEKLIYPTQVSIEQATSEALAKFHANLFAEQKTVLDLTCGLGVDDYYISEKVESVTTIDINPTVADIAIRNFRELGRNNVTVHCQDSEAFVKTNSKHFDACFADPSRRLGGDRNQRLYSLTDCVPSIQEVLPKLQETVNFIIVKASPMIDLTKTIKDFPGITDVWILSVKNDCKELLFKIPFTTEQPHNDTSIHAINFDTEGIQEFTYTFGTAEKCPEQTPEAGKYLYVPNASIMKVGAFNQVSKAYGLSIISQNSHLFLSNNYLADFPGRKFQIAHVFSLSKPDMKSLKALTDAANISCRNFPLTPEELRKRLKLKDGGNCYIFATTTANKKNILLFCEKR